MHATVNLHCTHVTFCKIRCPWSQVINTGQGNWMLIGETIDQSLEKIVRSDLMIHLILISRHVKKGERDNRHLTASIHHHYYWLFVEAEGPVILAECPCMMPLGNKIHLSLFLSVFPQTVSRHVVFKWKWWTAVTFVLFYWYRSSKISSEPSKNELLSSSTDTIQISVMSWSEDLPQGENKSFWRV